MKSLRYAAAAAALAAAAGIFGPAALAQNAHVMQSLAEAQWGPAPPMLPPGAKIAVLFGDPTSNSNYAVRLQFPAGYLIPAHSHPTDENVTVVSGALTMGLGDKVDKAAGHEIGVGGFAKAPANVNHWALAKTTTTIVLFGQGPVEFNYVNPKDDPRNANRAASK